jgi:hypothetical protein
MGVAVVVEEVAAAVAHKEAEGCYPQEVEAADCPAEVDEVAVLGSVSVAESRDFLHRDHLVAAAALRCHRGRRS